jgi:hypothetical protein
MDYLTRNKDKPIIVQILPKALLDYTTEYFRINNILNYDKRDKKSQTKIKRPSVLTLALTLADMCKKSLKLFWKKFLKSY